MTRMYPKILAKKIRAYIPPKIRILSAFTRHASDCRVPLQSSKGDLTVEFVGYFSIQNYRSGNSRWVRRSIQASLRPRARVGLLRSQRACACLVDLVRSRRAATSRPKSWPCPLAQRSDSPRVPCTGRRGGCMRHRLPLGWTPKAGVELRGRRGPAELNSSRRRSIRSSADPLGDSSASLFGRGGPPLRAREERKSARIVSSRHDSPRRGSEQSSRRSRELEAARRSKTSSRSSERDGLQAVRRGRPSSLVANKGT